MISERLNDYDANFFLNDLFTASKYLGMLEAKISGYQFSSILIPMLRNKEAISSMSIEGTQTTITDVLEDKVSPAKRGDDRILCEYRNHTTALVYSAEYLRGNGFTDDFIKKIHEIMMTGILPSQRQGSIGKYKDKDNFIVNSTGTVVFVPPSHTETQRYMRELLNFMNNSKDGINPLIKSAIIHSQFESIHPFEDGNGRVGRLLISLYLYKTKVINFPFFYISEAINQDKLVYYNKLTGSRTGNYNEWIRFFLQKCVVQANKHISYIDSLNDLYERTKLSVKDCINSQKYDQVIEVIFTQPVLTVSYLAEQICVTPGQAKRYMDKLEEHHILLGDDRKRNRKYYFLELLELARR